MIVLGIDPGLTRQNPTGLALLNDSGQFLSSETFAPARSKMSWQDFLYVLADDVLEFIWTEKDQIDLVAYELPHVALNPQTTIKLAHICGIITAAASRYDISLVAVQPSEAKKALTGKGNAGKTEMTLRARERFSKPLLTKDEADACGIALAGLAKYRKR